MTKLLLAVATMALLVIAGGVSILVARSTFASIPDQAGVIHACYSNFGSPQGSLRVIDTASSFPYGSASCKPGETPITWNQTGTPGAPGTNGTNGTNGATNVTVRVHQGEAANAGSAQVASCMSGETVTGGGFQVEVTGTGAIPYILFSRPVPDGVPTGWQAQVNNAGNTGTSTVKMTTYVLCAAP